MPLCHCFSHSLVFTFASADPTHDIKQYFTERKPIFSRSAYDQAVDRFRKNDSFGHVRADLFGAKDAMLAAPQWRCTLSHAADAKADHFGVMRKQKAAPLYRLYCSRMLHSPSLSFSLSLSMH
jgi:hypothetical protein